MHTLNKAEGCQDLDWNRNHQKILLTGSQTSNPRVACSFGEVIWCYQGEQQCYHPFPANTPQGVSLTIISIQGWFENYRILSLHHVHGTTPIALAGNVISNRWREIGSHVLGTMLCLHRLHNYAR